MDANLCIRDLGYAMANNDRAWCHRALADLEKCLKRGQTAVFNASIAGRNSRGHVRRSLPFYGTPYAIMTVDPSDDAAGYALFVYDAKGNETARYPLAQRSL